MASWAYLHKYKLFLAWKLAEFIYIFTPTGEKYKTNLENEEKYIVYNFFYYENQIYENKAKKHLNSK